MLLEVCVDSLASARAAIAGGADRLELCSALLAGGLTPYTELLRQIRRESDVAVRCLIRPRAGDFLYMPEEIEMMCAQIPELRSAGDVYKRQRPECVTLILSKKNCFGGSLCCWKFVWIALHRRALPLLAGRTVWNCAVHCWPVG